MKVFKQEIRNWYFFSDRLLLLHLIVRASQSHCGFVYSQGGAIVQIVYNPAPAVREHRVEGSSGHKKFWGELENLT